MPLPATVDASLSWPSWKNAKIYVGEMPNGTEYFVGLDKTNNHVEMWKSTDGGNTWSEQDSENHKSLSTTTANKSATACVDGTRILVIYGHPSAGFIGMVPYETTTDLWGTALAITATGITTDTTGQLPLAVACRGSNDYVAAYQSATESIMGTAYRRVSVKPFTISTAGTAVVVEAGVQEHQDVGSLVAGSAGRVHILYRTASTSTLRHRTFLSGNTLGTAGNISSNYTSGATYPIGVPISYVDGADTKVIVPIRTSTALVFHRFVSADTPSLGGSTTITSGAGLIPEHTNSNPAAVALDGLVPYCFWPNDTDQDLYRSNEGAFSAWIAAIEYRDAITVQGINIAKITDAFGILYEDAGTLKYDSFSLALTYARKPTIINQAVRGAVTR